MILRGHNLLLSSFAGCTLCFSASNMGVWLSKSRPTPSQLGFKKITENNQNATELFKLVLKEQKERIESRFGKGVFDEHKLKSWCISNQVKPWVKDFKDVLDFCYIPKKVAYRLVSEGYRIKAEVLNSTSAVENCKKEKLYDYISDGATTVNYLIVKGDCIDPNKKP